MSVSEPPDHRVAERANLLPEEARVGSDDPGHQAEVILEDSDRRTAQPDETLRESAQTPDPELRR